MSNKRKPLSAYKRYAIKKITGGQLTYSQLGEDLIIDCLLEYKKNGTYIDIGANDPFIFSNTCLFHKKGWKGINIDPNLHNIQKFNKYRPKALNINAGAGQAGTIPFYEFKEDVLNTFDETIKNNNERMGHPVANVRNVPVIPLREIFEKHVPEKRVDFISIDTEGFDMQVLGSNDWKKYRAKLVILETLEYRKDGKGKKLNDIFDPYMKSIGYAPIAETYINTIYIDIISSTNEQK